MKRPNYADAVRFLEVLDPSANSRSEIDGCADGFTFQTFDDNKQRKHPEFAKLLFDTFAEVRMALTQLNAAGAGIFVSVNETDMKGRRKPNITRMRAVWIDDDSKSGVVPKTPLEPHLVVESSPGKYQLMFLVDGLTAEEHDQVQQRMILDYGSDPIAKGVHFVLRIPGFYHLKGEPFMSKLLVASDAPPYTAEMLKRAFPPVIEQPKIPSRAVAVVEEDGIVPMDDSKVMPDITLLNAFQYLPTEPNLSRETWLKVGMALHYQFGGSFEGLELFDRWSQGVRSYVSFEDVNANWRSFKQDSARLISFAYVMKMFRDKQTAVLAADSTSTLHRAVTLIEGCEDAAELLGLVAPRAWSISDARHNTHFEVVLIKALQDKYLELTKNSLNQRKALNSLKQKLQACVAEQLGISRATPKWATDWVWNETQECFYHTVTTAVLTKEGFNSKFDSELRATGSDSAHAATMVLDGNLVPKVRDGMYWPQKEQFFEHGGCVYVNTFSAASRCEIPADVAYNNVHAARFKKHIELVCGGWNREAQLLVNYLACVIGHPARKVRWMPLIIGDPGSGKSLFYDFVRNVVGMRNTQLISATAIMKSADSGFNGWAAGHCFGAIEEIKWHGHNRFDVANAMKAVITNPFIPLYLKHKESFDVPNTVNYMGFSNYKSAYPIESGDRRIFVLYSQHAMSELSDDYFSLLFESIDRHCGDIARWVLDVPVHVEFLPDNPAPMTPYKRSEMEFSRDDSMDVVEEILKDQACHLFCPEYLCFAPFYDAFAATPEGREVSAGQLRLMLIKLGFTKLEGRPTLKYQDKHIKQTLWVINGVTLEYVKGKMK